MAEQKVAIVTAPAAASARRSPWGSPTAGYAVVLAGRRAEKLDQTAKEAGNPRTCRCPPT